MFRLLQKVLNLSEIKLPSDSDINFFGSPYSAKITLHVSIRLSVDKSCFLDDSELAMII